MRRFSMNNYCLTFAFYQFISHKQLLIKSQYLLKFNIKCKRMIVKTPSMKNTINRLIPYFSFINLHKHSSNHHFFYRYFCFPTSCLPSGRTHPGSVCKIDYKKPGNMLWNKKKTSQTLERNQLEIDFGFYEIRNTYVFSLYIEYEMNWLLHCIRRSCTALYSLLSTRRIGGNIKYRTLLQS